MRLRRVPAHQRFTKTGFRMGADWLTSPPTFWTCGTCGKVVRFVFQDCIRHVGSTFSNLIPQDAQAIHAWAAADDCAHMQRPANAYLDFYCPACALPVRVYFVSEALTGARPAAFGCDIRFVVEGIPL